MSHDFLDDRRHALEEAFFARHNKELVEKMRHQAEAAEERSRLAAATGISDESVLNRFQELGLHPSTLSALSLVPLVLVAWADGKLEPKEQKVILAAAEANGIEAGSEAHQSLLQWLHELPPAGLYEAWRDYVQALCRDLGEDGTQHLRTDILGRALKVAKAAGGWWDLGAVSHEEEGVLARLEKAFE
jgi:hypothetical protein